MSAPAADVINCRCAPVDVTPPALTAMQAQRRVDSLLPAHRNDGRRASWAGWDVYRAEMILAERWRACGGDTPPMMDAELWKRRRGKWRASRRTHLAVCRLSREARWAVRAHPGLSVATVRMVLGWWVRLPAAVRHEVVSLDRARLRTAVVAVIRLHGKGAMQ